MKALDSHGCLRPHRQLTGDEKETFNDFKRSMNADGQASGKAEEKEVAKHALAIATEIADASSLDDALQELNSVLKHVSVYIYIKGF